MLGWGSQGPTVVSQVQASLNSAEDEGIHGLEEFYPS